MEEISKVESQQVNGMMNAPELNKGTVTVESARAIAEAQGKLRIAKMFPRNEIEAYEKAKMACQRLSFAEKAFYTFPRGKESVSGVTIRFAEELARCYGNLDYGIKELSNDDGKSEMQAYCWDLEQNVIASQNFGVKHIRETKYGNSDLTSQRDIYELNANNGSRRLRSMILRILPPDLVDECIKECRKTLAGDNSVPLADKIRNMVSGFAKLGVTKEMLEKRMGHTVESTSPDEIVDYIGLYRGLKDKEVAVSELFERPKTAAQLTELMNNDSNERK